MFIGHSSGIEETNNPLYFASKSTCTTLFASGDLFKTSGSGSTGTVSFAGLQVLISITKGTDFTLWLYAGWKFKLKSSLMSDEVSSSLI